MNLEEFKKKYSVFEKKYNLPSFKELNDDFEIEKIEKDSDCLLRVIRKIVMEKIVNSISFVDMLLNPVNAPRMYFSYIKSLSLEDRKIIEEIYSNLSELSVASLALEIDSNDKKEAELIKKSFDSWNSCKKGFREIVSKMANPSTPARRERSYFG
jgi:hypothetical protein